MKTQRSTNYRWDRAALGTCFALMLTGLIVLVGWHAHIRAAIPVFPGLIPMPYNTALCFLALGAAGAGLLMGRRLFQLGGGSFAALMGAAVILQYATGISFGIDTLFFYPWERTLSSEPGRMALTTAISFFLTGSALIILVVRRGAYAIFGIVNSIPLSLALTSLIGYAFQITYVLPFSLGSQMALLSAAAFLAYGLIMLGHAWKYSEHGPDGLPKWGPGISAAFLPMLLVVASALFPKQSWRVVPLEALFSILGVTLITLAALRLSRAKVAYKGLLMIAIPLILLLIFVGLVIHVKHQSESAEVLALKSKEVIGVSQSLLAHIAETESAARGYVITSDETFIDSYERSLELVTQKTTELRNLVSDNPTQEASAGKIEQLTTQRVDHLARIVRLMKTGDKQQAEEEIKGGQGADLMRQVRLEMGAFLQEEDRLGAQRRQILNTSWQKLSWLLVAGTAAAILLASILTLLFSGSISNRLKLLRDNAISLAAGKELAPPLTGHDEIAELDQVFHEMAESLDEVTRREKAVIEGTADAIYIKDLEHRYLMINQAGADSIGRPVDMIVGFTNDDVLEAESARRIREQDNETIASGETITYEMRSSNKAGVERTYLSTRAPYRDRHGSIVGTMGISRDITQEKLAEEALATSEKRYRTLIDEGQGLICTHDLEGNLLSVNPAAAESLGYTPAEMLGRNLIEYLTPAVQQVFQHYLRRIRSEPSVNGLLYFLNKQGEERIWMYRNTLIAEPGASAYVLGYAQDVTDSKKAEGELRTLTQRLSLATQVGNIGVWDWDVQTNSINWDERMFEIYGVARGTAIDYDHWKAAVVAEDLPAAEASVQLTLTRKSQEVAEFRILRSDGSLRHVQTAQGVIMDRAGKVMRVIGLNLDITEHKQLENTLRQERIFLRAVIDNIPDSVYVKDMECRKVIANLAEVRLSGMQSEAELLGKDDFAVHPKELAEHFFADDQVVLHTGQPVVNREEYVLSKQGEKSWILTTKIPLRDENGQIVGLIGLGRNITERKRAEEALIESDRRFRDLFYDAPVGYHELDTEGRITCVNTTELLMLGYSSEEMIGHHVWEFIEDGEIARETFAEKLKGIKPVRNVERSFRRKDGTFMEVQLDDQMLKDPSGRIVGIRATLQDITERKRTEEALRENEQRFRDLFENASDVIYTADSSGNFTSLNKSGQRMMGYTHEEAVGLNFSQVVAPEGLKLAREMIQFKQKNSENTVYELEMVKKNGEPLLVEISSRAIYKNGKAVGIQGIGRDITQRKQVEAELKLARDAAVESVRLKSEFLANMSHEIRTPMNGVIGMTGLLLETDLTSPQREYTETIQSSAEALLTIIGDILDFSKIEAGLLRFEKIDFELRGAVEAPVELLAERAQAKGLELASIVYQDVPTALRGDPGRLRQVLTNLIGNSVKFTERGEVMVNVMQVNETASHAMLRFEIHDTGIGISVEAQRGLFRAFTQADGSTTRKYGGTGLGLAISKQLVELMGGEIGIESAPGAGSTFWFTGKFEKQLNGATKTKEPAGNLSGVRLLIVDDNATNRKILKHQTSSWGMIASEAESGELALELLRSGVAQGEPYDIAVLDLMMPLMDGFQLAEAIKSDPTIAAVALVLLPSFGMLGHGERATQTGIAAYLQKPVRQSQLYDCLTTLMSQPDSGPVTVTQLITRHSLRESQFQQKDKTFSAVRILIAEDNLVNQKVALGQLNNLGYRAKAVSNGRELLETLENNHVDIILMDCQMPEMDGFEATAEIRRREGAARHTTIIAMTANALEGDDQKCLAAGMDDYISKPVKSEVLRLKLERWTKQGESGNGLSEIITHAQPTHASTTITPPRLSLREPSIDHDQLASLEEIQKPGEADFVTELIDLFLEESTSDLKALHQALSNHDEAGVARVAHRLKGSSANMGAMQMASLAEELEGKDPAKDAIKLAALEKEFVLVREALKIKRNETELTVPPK